MWIYLNTGFYSVVHKPPCQKDELLVRTRSKVDIDKLQKQLKEKFNFDGEILSTPKADYAFRMVVPRHMIATFLVGAIMELDYPNFKNTIQGKDYQRHDAYMKCWEAMYEWQRDSKKEL